MQLLLQQNKLEYFKATRIFSSMTGAYKSGAPASSNYERVDHVSRYKKALYLQLLLQQNKLEYFKASRIFLSMTGAHKSGAP